ncbi:MAG TPA: AcrB/AcrD/AcrF family protein [Lentisphaeria bacterium]|nr:MAG: hypothetical protein A2X48_11540 [Lentisphaerae bacterium GWF2_49_21]HBC85555.1 AcrB/AcrD/AcrF family protein [Lentisphaeria bacterium]
MLLSDYSIQKRVCVFTALFFSVVTGIYCYTTLPREAFPDITVPYVFISTSYEGVSPEEIENLITIKLEKKLKGLDNVKEIKSTSVEGFSSITIEFYPNEEIDSAVQKVKDKVDLAKGDLPEDLESDPVVSEVNLSTDIPIMGIAFSGNESLPLLKKTVEDIQDQVESVPGVLEAKIFGDREREIRIEVDIERLNAYRIPARELIELIRRENSNVTGGNIEMDGGKFQVRVPGEFIKPEDINGLIVTVRDGKPIYLTDLARISDIYKDLSSISRINGGNCVSLMIQKRSGANIIKVTSEVKKILEEWSTKFPGGIKYTITSDLSKDTHSMIYELENNILSGLLLIILILPLTMGLRNSIFVAAAIPLSMLIGFIVFYAMGRTLNMVLLFSLILASGMLVDNAIVIVENIYRNRCNGMDAMQASRIGSDEVAWPVITSTLTTLAAFLPLMFWPDTTGEFMFYIPLGVSVTLSASLLVAIVFNPAVCSVFIKPREQCMGKSIFSGWKRSLDRLGDWLIGKYEDVLRDCLRYPLLIVGLGGLLLVFTLLLYAEFQKGVEFFPDVDPRRADIVVRYPEATEIRKTNALVKKIEGRLAKFEDIQYYISTVGSAGGLFMGGESGTHLATVSVEFKEMEKRKYPSPRVIDAIRSDLNGFMDFRITRDSGDGAIRIKVPMEMKDAGESIRILTSSMLKKESIGADVILEVAGQGQKIEPVISVPGGIKDSAKIAAMLETERTGFAGAEIIVKKEKEGPQADSPISIEVSGDNYQTIALLSDQIVKMMEEVPGIADLRDNYDNAKPELKFIVDRNRATLLGFDTVTISNFIRTAINGMEVSKFREDEDEFDITIRLPETQRTDTSTLLNMLIPIPGKSPVALASLGQFQYTSGYGTIHRSNMNRTITIDADVRPGAGVDKVLSAVKARMSGMPMPQDCTILFRGENEKRDEAADFLFKAFWIAIFLIAIILVAQFNSLFVPGIILTSVLLSFIGVFSSLLIHEMKFSVIMTGIGIISLAGVVVNNAIVLIDCIILQRGRGMSLYEATVTAGKFRMRPVLLTAITTVFGLIPMAVGWSIDFHRFPPAFTSGEESSQWWRLMALVVIYGLSVATVLTLVFVPCLYFQLEKYWEKFLARFKFSGNK